MRERLSPLIPRSIAQALHRRSRLAGAIFNSGWLLADRIMRTLVGLAVVIVLARSLGPQQYGLLTYAMATVAMFSAFTSLGLDNLVVRNLVHQPGHAPQILGTVFALRLAGVVATFLLSVAAALLANGNEQGAIVLVLVLAAGNLFLAFDTVDLWFQSKTSSRLTVIAKAVPFLVAAALKVALAVRGASVAVIAVVYALEAAAAGIALLVALGKSGRSAAGWRFDVGIARQLIVEGWPLLLAAVFIAFRIRIDQVMVGHFASMAEVANYSVAVRIVETWYVIPMVITVSIFPAIIESKKIDETDYRRKIQSIFAFLLWMSIGIATFTGIAAPLLLGLLFGPAYAGAAGALSVFAWTCTWVFFGVARARWLVLEGHSTAAFPVEAIAVAISIASNYVLVPRFGGIGAAVAALVTVFGANTIASVFSAPIRESMIMYVRSIWAPLSRVQKALARR